MNLIFTVSCNNTPTFEELKTAERKVVRRIIAEKGIDVLKDFPANGVFGENQFFELESGIYLNIVDSGNGNRANSYTDVLVRVSGEYYSQDTVYTFNLFKNDYDPFVFKYGQAYNVKSQSPNYFYYSFFGTGLESILSYVGDSSMVKLIVPAYSEINESPAGSNMQNESMREFVPIYYDRVRYIFY